MMKHTLGFLVLGTATFACSGRYYEVGAIDGVGGTRGAAGGAASGGNSSSTAGTSDTSDPGVGATAGTGNAGPSMPAGDLCLPSGAPPKLTGPFADPAVVWQRISMLTYGTLTPVPSGLPATTTYAWAGTAVKTELADARNMLGQTPGVELFLRQALALDEHAIFNEPWGIVASTNNSLLNALLMAPLEEPGRVGIFSEPAWLAENSDISTRGSGMSRVLFNSGIPAPPAGIQNPPPNPNLSDRANLEAAVSSSVACVGCHTLMDPLGFALGHFAADGAYRALDHGQPIDTTGSHRSGMSPGDLIDFDGIADFGQKFSEDCAAMQGIAGTFLRAALTINGVAEPAQDELVDANLTRVQQAFVNSNRTYEDLVRAYIQSPAGLRP
jgi:Protein of unknown function (DUF1588)